MTQTEAIEKALEHFAKLLEAQLLRVDQMKAGEDWADYSSLKPIIIGVVGGDGIGPNITEQAVRVLEFALADEIASGKVELRDIPGLDIESRVRVMKALPEDALAALSRALGLAAPEGFVRIFVDEGAPMRRLCSRVQSESAAKSGSRNRRPSQAESPRALAQRLATRRLWR